MSRMQILPAAECMYSIVIALKKLQKVDKTTNKKLLNIDFDGSKFLLDCMEYICSA
jgi:hypothetical protein